MRPDRSGPRAHPPACPGRDRSPHTGSPGSAEPPNRAQRHGERHDLDHHPPQDRPALDRRSRRSGLFTGLATPAIAAPPRPPRRSSQSPRRATCPTARTPASRGSSGGRPPWATTSASPRRPGSGPGTTTHVPPRGGTRTARTDPTRASRATSGATRSTATPSASPRRFASRPGSTTAWPPSGGSGADPTGRLSSPTAPAPQLAEPGRAPPVSGTGPTDRRPRRRHGPSPRPRPGPGRAAWS